MLQVEHCQTDGLDRPVEPVIITAAGELTADYDINSIPPLMEGSWPLWAEDCEAPPDVRSGQQNEVQFRLGVSRGIKEEANQAYKQVRRNERKFLDVRYAICRPCCFSPTRLGG